MYSYLLFFHSVFRWLVVISLSYAVVNAISGWVMRRQFRSSDNTIRQVSTTISHIQLSIGYVLYFESPLIAYFRSDYSAAVQQFELKFFGIIHITLMTIAIFVITIGSSLTKKQASDRGKFQTMAAFFAIALMIIFLAVPWPFSPFANRPYYRLF